MEHGCQWYQQVHFTDQLGAPKTEWGCAVQWLPQLIIHQVKETGHIGAAIESARNEARKDAAAIGAGLVEVAEAARKAASHVVHGELLEARPPRRALGRLRSLIFRGEN